MMLMGRPIKICFVSASAYPYFNPALGFKSGGAELQIYYFATELAKDPNFQVQVVVGDFGQPLVDFRDGVTLLKVKFSEISPTSFVNKVVRAIKPLLKLVRMFRVLNKANADIYIQRCAGIETIITGFVASLRGRKFVYMSANDQDVGLNRPDWFLLGRKKDIVWSLFKKTLRKADAVVLQHSKQLKTFQKNYNRSALIRYSAHRWSEQAVLEEKRQFVLWISRCQPLKQPELFVRLAKDFSQEQFVMICPESGQKEYLDSVKAVARDVGNLKVIDSVPLSQINDYFAKAKFFVNTSTTEGFPNTFVQSAMAGTPILSLNVDLGGILQDFAIGFYANNNFADLENKMRLLLADQAAWQKMSDNGRRYAAQYHDIKKVIESDKKLIVSLVRNENPS